MNNKLRSQKGQALALIAIGMLAMVAITGLAIDGGNAFSDRRHAQNAADTAALSAALAKVLDQNWEGAGLNLAVSNGYSTDVTVTNPPGPGCNGAPGPYAGNDDYVQVIIHSTVDTFFARVIGVNQMHSCVEAIAKALPPIYKPFALGNAIAAMDCTGKWTIKSTGTSDTNTFNGGVFSNSNDDHAFLINDNDNLIIEPGFFVTAVGGFDAPSDYSPVPIEGVDQIECPLPDYWYPKWSEDDCESDYTVQDFPDDIEADLETVKDGRDVYEMDPGATYCITRNFNKPMKPLYGQGVHIVLIDADLQWNSTAELHLSAGQTTDLSDPDPLNGILIYSLPSTIPASSDTPELRFNGTSDSELTGTIFAPNSAIVMNGDYTGSSLQAQFIGATVDLTGGTGINIEYDKGLNGGYTDPARIELSK